MLVRTDSFWQGPIGFWFCESGQDTRFEFLLILGSAMTGAIGWVGTGVMGAAMCRRLLERGREIVVFNRTRSKAQPLIDLGASWASSPAEVARRAEIVFTMVGFPADVARVYQAEDGLLNGVESHGVLVDMTTTKPSLARNLWQAAKARGAQFVDAPVSGGDVGAVNGTLSIMIGGDQPVVEDLMPLFQIMGKNIVYQGLAGCGQHAKMCNQIAIAGTMIGVCESLIYGRKAGIGFEGSLAGNRLRCCRMLDSGKFSTSNT